MQKKHLLLGSALGGALLASTSLTSTAFAQSLVFQAEDGGVPEARVGEPVATTEFAVSGGASVDVGGAAGTPLVYQFASPVADRTITLAIRASTGAFKTTSDAATVLPSADFITNGVAIASVLLSTGAASVADASCGAVSIVGGLLSVTCTAGAATTQLSGDIGSIYVGSVAVTQAQALATAGTALELSAAVYDGTTVTAGALISGTEATLNMVTSADVTSVAAITAATLTAEPTATPAFSVFDSNAATGNIGGVLLTYASATNPDLLTTADPAAILDATDGLNLAISHDAFTQAGFDEVRVIGIAGATVAQQSAGGFDGDNDFEVAVDIETGVTYTGQTDLVIIQIAFDGTTAIETADAGTITATLGSAGTTPLVIATASGSLSTISRGGVTAELNMLQSSDPSILGDSSFQSFVRITNSGAVAGAASITLINAETGETLGVATSDSIPVNGTVQLSSADLESSAGITAIAGQYNVIVSGPFEGYVQHVQLNSDNLFFSDLSGFRGPSGAPNEIP